MSGKPTETPTEELHRWFLALQSDYRRHLHQWHHTVPPNLPEPEALDRFLWGEAGAYPEEGEAGANYVQAHIDQMLTGMQEDDGGTRLAGTLVLATVMGLSSGIFIGWLIWG